MNFWSIDLPAMPDDLSEVPAWARECARLYGPEIARLTMEQAFLTRLAQMGPDDGPGAAAMARPMGSPPAPRPASRITTTPTDEGASSTTRGSAIPADIDLTALTVDLVGVESPWERLVRVAEAVPPGTLLNTTQVSRLVHRSGVTDAPLQTIRVGIQRALDADPQRFQKVRSATYRYMVGAQTADPTHDLTQAGPRPRPRLRSQHWHRPF